MTLSTSTGCFTHEPKHKNPFMQSLALDIACIDLLSDRLPVVRVLGGSGWTAQSKHLPPHSKGVQAVS